MDKLLRPDDPKCCDLHGRNCEQGGDECCERCTEAHHFDILPAHGGLPCSNPVLSGFVDSGPVGGPSLAIVHGGEYVLSRDGRWTP